MIKHLSLKAYGKINLGLDVLRRREDGYHDVRMIMQTVGIFDRVDLIRKEEPGIQVETNLYYLPTNENNLVYKAAKLLMDEFQVQEGLLIRLRKFIPVAAGMAGGSSDAAAVLRGLRTLYAPNMTDTRLEKMAEKLGSDVPFFIRGGTALATGRGEKLEALPKMPQCWLVIVKPEESHSTAAMYAAIDSAESRSGSNSRMVLEGLDGGDLAKIAAGLSNDFQQVLPEGSAIPAIVETLRQQGALNAQMTGSGSAVFGLFHRREDAELAASVLKEDYPQTFCVPQV